MKKIIVLIMAFVLVFIVSCKASDTKKSEQKLGEGEYALVNGEKISKEDFDKTFNLVKYQYEAQYGKEFFEKKENQNVVNKLKSSILEEKIMFKLIKKYAKDEKIYIDEKKFDKEVEKVNKNLEADKKLSKYLKDNKIGKKDIENIVRDRMIVAQITKNIQENIEKDSKKMEEIEKKYIVKVKASHILLKDKADADKIYESLKKEPKNFEKIAKEKSTDKGSAVKDGDLGYFARGMMVPEFEKAAFDGKINEIQKPVKSQFGYHIIKTTGKKTLSDLKADGANKDELELIKKQILSKDVEAEYTKKIEDLKKKANILKTKFEEKK